MTNLKAFKNLLKEYLILSINYAATCLHIGADLTFVPLAKSHKNIGIVGSSIAEEDLLLQLHCRKINLSQFSTVKSFLHKSSQVKVDIIGDLSLTQVQVKCAHTLTHRVHPHSSHTLLLRISEIQSTQ